MNDNINPVHYQSGSKECIDVIKDMGIDVIEFCKGNTIKYLYRFEMKGGVEDLVKAKWYINRMISELKNESE